MTRTERARRDLERAEQALARRASDNGLTFSTVDRALTWYFEARERHQSPQALHPRGETHHGEVVFVQVEGGPGGDLDDVLCTVSAIGTALRELQERHPQQHDILVRALRDGVSARKLADRHKLSHQAVSVLRGRGEAFLAGCLAARGVLR